MFAGLSKGNIGVPLLLLVILAMVTLPVPPFLLDVLFTFNIALSIVVLLVCVLLRSPPRFRYFPNHYSDCNLDAALVECGVNACGALSGA